jgi:hypothetical protein
MFVAGTNRLELNAGRSNELPGIIDPDTTLADEHYLNPSFLDDFPDRGVVRQLIRLDVAAGWKPHLELSMPK